MSNPFNSRDNVTNDIANILNQHRADRENKISDSLRSAAEAAGREVKDAGRVSIETKNKIYNDHFVQATGNTPPSRTARTDFENIADNTLNQQ
jgi:hypothetical protein